MSGWEQRGFLEAVTLKLRLKVNRSCPDVGVKVKRQLESEYRLPRSWAVPVT